MEVELKECQIQSQCVQWFRFQYPEFIIFSTNNEACFRRITYFNSLGLLNGVSDLIILLPHGKTLFIEMKNKKGRQREEQKTFQEKVEGLGFHYFICRSLEQFQEIINNNII